MTRLSVVRFGEKNVSVDRNRSANISRREHARQRHAASPLVVGEHVVVAARVVELLGLRLDEHVIVRQLAEVDGRLRHLEVRRRRERQVLDEQDRQALFRDFVDRAERQPVAVGEGEVLVDPRPARKAPRVQLASRQHDLPVLPVDRVAVVIDGDEVVVGPDLLDLAERVEQRPIVPERHVVDRRRVPLEVRARQAGFARQRLLHRSVQAERGPRRVDVMDDEGRLLHLFVGSDDETLDDRRVDAPADRHGHIQGGGGGDRPEPSGAQSI